MILIPFLRLLKNDIFRLTLGLLLAILGLSASIGLLSLSGWFLSASFLVGSTAFNFFYPSSGVRGLAIGRTVTRYGDRMVTHDVTFRLLAYLRLHIFQKLLPLSPEKLQQFRNSEILNVLVSDVDTLDTLYLSLITPFITAIMVILFMGFGLSFISVEIALVICSTLMILLFLLPTIFYRLGSSLGEEILDERNSFRRKFVEWVMLNAEFTLFNKLSSKKKSLLDTQQLFFSKQNYESKLTGFSSALLVVLNGLLVCVVILLASSATLPNVENAQALIAIFVFATLASIEILIPISSAFLHLGKIISAAKRVNALTEQDPIVYGNVESLDESGENMLNFCNLSFAYGKHKVLNNFNLAIKKKEKIAILGKTGAGKSTIFNLLNRNIEPQSGEILLKNTKLLQLSESLLRSQIITLTQKVHIFNQSLADNLRFGNELVDDERLREVLESVGLSHLTETKEGLNIFLGDGGRTLSGGESRRLGLARVLLHDAPIVLLDEPTEGLDRKTEEVILDLIFEKLQDKTIICITHRATMLDRFDEKYHLKDGKLLA